MMNAIDLTPLYRNTIGFDRFAHLLNSSLGTEHASPSYPPYNIEVHDENRYAITVAVAGFSENELDINIEHGILSIRGKKEDEKEKNYLHQDIANRTFERKFNLADYVEVTEAALNNGLLTINLAKEIPEAIKPKNISINQDSKTIEHQSKKKKEGKVYKAA